MGLSTQGFLAKNSFMVASVLGFSAILGVLRESAMAYQFGATGVTDAYLIALIIPTLFINLIRGSITNTFITVYGGRLAQGQEQAGRRMTNIVLTGLGVGLGGLTLAFFLGATPLVRLVAPSYTGEQLTLAVELTKILLPSIILGGLMGILVGINNAHHSFFIPSAIWPVSNLIVIASIFGLGPRLGIRGLAIGTLVGTLAQLLIQIPTARQHGWRFEPTFDRQDPGVRETLWLVTPFILSAAASQVNLVIDRMLATGLQLGAVSSLYYANKLVFLPQSIFTAALGMVVFPLLVEAASRGDWFRVVDGVYRAVRLLLLILLPAISGMYLLRYPLVRLLFQHGAFRAEDTVTTAGTLPYFFGALFFGGLVMILVNIYFATKKMVVAVGTGVISLSVNIGLSLWLIHPLQQKGLALANSLSALVNFLLLSWGLFRILQLQDKVKLPWREGMSFLRNLIYAVGGMMVSVWAFREFIGQGMRTGGVMLTLEAVALGAAVYFTLLFLLRVEEIHEGINKIRGILKLGK